MPHAGLEKSGAQAYSIVHVPKRHEVSAVPSAWVVGDRVLWPPYRSTTRIKTAVEDQEEPSEGWTSYDCRMLFTCASYDIARQKEQQAALTSDLASDNGCYEEQATLPFDLAFDNGRREPKRKRRAQRLASSDEEGVYGSDAECVTPVSGPLCGPARAPLNSVSQPPTPKFRKTAPSKGTTVAMQPTAPSLQPVAATLQALPTASIQPILKMQEETFKLLNEMKAQLDTLENAVQGLQNSVPPRQTSGGSTDTGMLDLLPLATHQDLEKLEHCLRTLKNRTGLVAHFSLFGGSSLIGALRYLMRKCMKDALAQDFSLTGRKGKRPFNALQLLQVVTETLQKAYTTATETDIHSGIAAWLRHAPSRQKKREAALASGHKRSPSPRTK